MNNLPGHFSQITGDSAEEDFYALSRAIGYVVFRSRNPSPGIDFVADFVGRPTENCTLLRPPFSPAGLTAFSVKSGDFVNADVEELLTYVSQCTASTDPTLKEVKGGVLVAGTNRTKGQLDDLVARGVYCWDIKRLIFYSVKAKTVFRLSDLGPVVEHPLHNGIKGGFVLSVLDMTPTEVQVEAHVFVDDHNIVIQGDHVESILDQVSTLGLTPITNATHHDVRTEISLHALGPIQRLVADDAYRRYAAQANNRRILFPADRGLEMQSYATGPWTAIFRE